VIVLLNLDTGRWPSEVRIYGFLNVTAGNQSIIRLYE